MCFVIAVGELLRQESDRQLAITASKRSSLSRKKVLRRRRTSERSGSKRPSVTDHQHGSTSKQVTPTKRTPFRGVFLKLFGYLTTKADTTLLVQQIYPCCISHILAHNHKFSGYQPSLHQTNPYCHITNFFSHFAISHNFGVFHKGQVPFILVMLENKTIRHTFVIKFVIKYD